MAISGFDEVAPRASIIPITPCIMTTQFDGHYDQPSLHMERLFKTQCGQQSSRPIAAASLRRFGHHQRGTFCDASTRLAADGPRQRWRGDEVRDAASGAVSTSEQERAATTQLAASAAWRAWQALAASPRLVSDSVRTVCIDLHVVPARP